MSEDRQILERWQCHRCGDTHEDEDDAATCCQPAIKQVWECAICAEVFDTEAQALSHLQHDHDAEDFELLPYVIPQNITNPQQYVAKFCELNGLKP